METRDCSQRRAGGCVGVTANATKETASGVHGGSSDKAHAPVRDMTP